MDLNPLDPMILQEASVINDVQLLTRRADRGEEVRAQDVSALLDSYGTTFDELPYDLRHDIDEIDLAD